MSAQRLLDIARAKGVMVATAESCTGGMVAAAITDVAGSSNVFDRGFVTYSNAAKTDLLGVPATLIAAHGAVSEEVARAMAEGALLRSQAAIAVATTGIAGPGGSEHKPEGMVCFALASRHRETETETILFGAIGRADVRSKSVAHAIDLLILALY